MLFLIVVIVNVSHSTLVNIQTMCRSQIYLLAAMVYSHIGYRRISQVEFSFLFTSDISLSLADGAKPLASLDAKYHWLTLQLARECHTS